MTQNQLKLNLFSNNLDLGFDFIIILQKCVTNIFNNFAFDTIEGCEDLYICIKYIGKLF